MTESEAIEIIEEYKGLFPNANNESESLDMAINALEKQIPKKPNKGKTFKRIDTVIVHGRNRNVEKIGYHSICPYCKRNVTIAMNFCNNCGQKLDWRMKNEID